MADTFPDFAPMNTAKSGVMDQQKLLLAADPGWGKTTQAMNYQKVYGKGFILSGESGLVSIADAGIDYLPFTSWDGKHDPANDVYSFLGVRKMMQSEGFKKQGYKWIMVDSLTEASDLAYEWAEAKEVEDAADQNRKVNDFAKYTGHNDSIIAECKRIRDLPYHVVVTALLKEVDDGMGGTAFRPNVRGKAVPQHLCGLFDHVFAGIRTTVGEGETPRIERMIVTDQVNGYLGKARDQKQRLRAIEETGNVTHLFAKMEMSDDEYEKRKSASSK